MRKFLLLMLVLAVYGLIAKLIANGLLAYTEAALKSLSKI